MMTTEKKEVLMHAGTCMNLRSILLNTGINIEYFPLYRMSTIGKSTERERGTGGKMM